MNDEVSSNSLVHSINNVVIEGEGGISTTAYDDYYYYSLQINQILQKQEEQTKILNEGFTFISFLVVVFIMYTLVKNFIRK